MTRSPRRLTLALTALVVVLGVAAPAAAEAATVAPSLESQLLQLTNRERTSRGLPALAPSLQMTRVARSWADTMAREQRLYHRPDLGSVVDGDWRRIGENVGVGPSIERIHAAFMDSPGHKANVLGDFGHVGIGVVEHEGRLWLTLNFLKGSGDFPVYRDVATTTHRGTIEDVFARATTNGCTTDRFCPADAVTRGQMATFLAHELGLSPQAPSGFRDISASNLHAGNIGALTSAGIATGCSGDQFCPNARISRAQMAEWMAAALRLAPRTATFSDVAASHPATGAIGALEAAGIVAGCAPDRYCPGDPVSRGQMTAFLARAWR